VWLPLFTVDSELMYVVIFSVWLAVAYLFLVYHVLLDHHLDYGPL